MCLAIPTRQKSETERKLMALKTSRKNTSGNVRARKRVTFHKRNMKNEITEKFVTHFILKSGRWRIIIENKIVNWNKKKIPVRFAMGIQCGQKSKEIPLFDFPSTLVKCNTLAKAMYVASLWSKYTNKYKTIIKFLAFKINYKIITVNTYQNDS